MFTSRRVPRQSFRSGLRCVGCGSRSRNRHVAATVVEALRNRGVERLSDLHDHPELRVLNTHHDSPLATALGDADHIDHTGYWEGVAAGALHGGVRCEDLTALSYDDDSLDVVVSEDVLEHIPAVTDALREIHRVLRPGGVHVFSIPFRADRRGEACFDLVDGEPLLHEPVAYHTDPIRGRVAVYHRFGYGLVEELDAIGFRTRIVASTHHDLRRHAIADATTFLTRRR